MREPIFHISHPEGLRRSNLRTDAIQHLHDACFRSIGSEVRQNKYVLEDLRAARAKIDALIAELEAK